MNSSKKKTGENGSWAQETGYWWDQSAFFSQGYHPENYHFSAASQGLVSFKWFLAPSLVFGSLPNFFCCVKSYIALHWESKTWITLERAELSFHFHHSGCFPGYSDRSQSGHGFYASQSQAHRLPLILCDAGQCSLSEVEVVGNTPVSWRKLRNWRVSTPEDNSQINNSFRAHEEKLKIRLLFWRAIMCMLRTNYAHLRGSWLQLHKRSSFDQRWPAMQWVALKSGVW